ncbi:MAG: 3-oxoacid CoA-transferase [Thermoplasmata archaeon]|nr:3-oxoacid CoA-transferase [Thermoplasmata archaeon]
MADYTTNELLACTAARVLEDRKAVFVGTGLPMIAGLLAQRLHAPNMLIVFEAGGIGPQVPVLPISVGDSRTIYRAIAASSMHEVMSMSQAGYLDFGFLGGAQIDMYGNLNTTVLGPHGSPKVRLPGSGGANDVGSLSHKTILIMRQDKRKFVQKLDFITTPGYLQGGNSRYEAGLPSGSGPFRVISQLAVFDFEPVSKRMRIFSVHPGVDVKTVLENSSFEILVPDEIRITQPPTKDELDMLQKIDPVGMVIAKR